MVVERDGLLTFVEGVFFFFFVFYCLKVTKGMKDLENHLIGKKKLF